MKFVHSAHFLQRNKIRNISENIAEKIFLEADGHYRDAQTKTHIAVKNMSYKNKQRDVGLVYTKLGDTVTFITIHPLKEHQLQNRIESGRWKPL
jgi:hypothetical protein